MNPFEGQIEGQIGNVVVNIPWTCPKCKSRIHIPIRVAPPMMPGMGERRLETIREQCPSCGCLDPHIQVESTSNGWTVELKVVGGLG